MSEHATNHVTVTLSKPITFADETITEITLRPVKGKDLRRLKATTDTGKTLELACMLSGQNSKVIDELEGKDLFAVIGAVNGFFDVSPMTGDDA